MKVISGKRMCAIVERHGWNLARIAGSHHIYVKPGVNMRLTIPIHSNNDLKRGLQRAIMKAAGIEDKDL
jgi:predicted RNA binding protein YcfA (HicA-like mRNA interferase family)